MNVSNLLHAASHWVLQSRAFSITQSVAHHRTPSDALSHWKLDIWHKSVPFLLEGGLAEPAHQLFPKHLPHADWVDELHHHLGQLVGMRREHCKVDIRAVTGLAQSPCSVHSFPSMLVFAHQHCRRIPHSTDADFAANRRHVFRYADQVNVFRAYDFAGGELFYMNEWGAHHFAALALQARTQNRELLVDAEVRHVRSAVGLRRLLDSFHVIGARRQAQQRYGTRLSEALASHQVPHRWMHGRRETEGFELCFLPKSDRFANCVGEQLLRDGWFDYGAWLAGLHDAAEVGAPAQRAGAARRTRANWKRVSVPGLGLPTGLAAGFAHTRL
jgi:hypothetical protein